MLKQIIFILFICFVLILPQASSAIGIQNSQQLIGTTASGAGVSTATADSIAAEVVKAILGIIGAIFFILILYGGITWMTAAGNDQKVGTAKKIIVTAIIGLAIVIFAYSITYFISSALGS